MNCKVLNSKVAYFDIMEEHKSPGEGYQDCYISKQLLILKADHYDVYK